MLLLGLAGCFGLCRSHADWRDGLPSSGQNWLAAVFRNGILLTSIATALCVTQAPFAIVAT
jgi:hypothetical protein